MNDNRQETKNLAREQYSAPTCKRFAFEASDLIQASGGGDPTPQSGSVSNFRNDVSVAASAFGDTPW